MTDTDQPIDLEDEAVQNALETLVELEETGTLEDLAAAANLVSLAGEAVDDDMVQSTMRAAVRAGELFDTAAGEPAALRNLEVFTAAMSEAVPEPDDPPERVGRLGAFGKLGDPKVQRGLGFTFRLLHEVGDQLEKRADRYDYEAEREALADLEEP